MNDQTKIEDITRQQEEQSYGTGLSSATVAEHCAALSGSYKRRGVADRRYERKDTLHGKYRLAVPTTATTPQSERAAPYNGDTLYSVDRDDDHNPVLTFIRDRSNDASAAALPGACGAYKCTLTGREAVEIKRHIRSKTRILPMNSNGSDSGESHDLAAPIYGIQGITDTAGQLQHWLMLSLNLHPSPAGSDKGDVSSLRSASAGACIDSDSVLPDTIKVTFIGEAGRLFTSTKEEALTSICASTEASGRSAGEIAVSSLKSSTDMVWDQQDGWQVVAAMPEGTFSANVLSSEGSNAPLDPFIGNVEYTFRVNVEEAECSASTRT